MSDKLPDDIDLEKRKNIIRRELDKLLGDNLVKRVNEWRRLKQKKFDRKKKRSKLAVKSQRRNRG